MRAYEEADVSCHDVQPARQKRHSASSASRPSSCRPASGSPLWAQLQRGGVLLRLGLCAIAAIFLWAFTRGWDPPFSYRLDDVLRRAHRRARRLQAARPGHDRAQPAARPRTKRLPSTIQDPEPLVQLRAKLRTEIGNLLTAKTLAEADAAAWAKFLPTPAAGTPDPTPEEREAQFQRFRESVRRRGRPRNIQRASRRGDGAARGARPAGRAAARAQRVAPTPRRSGSVQKNADPASAAGRGEHRRRADDRRSGGPAAESAERRARAAPRSRRWSTRGCEPQLPSTLTLDIPATKKAQDEAVAEVAEAFIPREKDVYVIAKAGEAINRRKARAAAARVRRGDRRADDCAAHWPLGRRARHVPGAVHAGGFYLYLRDRRTLDELLRLLTLLGLFVLTVTLATIVNWYAWGADIIPLLVVRHDHRGRVPAGNGAACWRRA